MVFVLDHLGTPSPVVEDIWHGHSGQGGTFASLAVSHCELVITRHQGEVSVTMRGPETRASVAHCPADAEFLGITFRLGTVLAGLSPQTLVDRPAPLPLATGHSFWLDDRALPIPDVADIGAFVEHLIRQRALRFDPAAGELLGGELLDGDVGVRTAQRRFRQTTGLTHRLVRSIERARQAAALLEHGSTIPDVVHALGYSDQPHLTKALRRFVGHTPGQIVGSAWAHSAWLDTDLDPQAASPTLGLAAD